MSPAFRQFLRQCWYRGWALVAVALILVALAFSALRLLLPAVPGYKTELEKIAGGYLDAPVSIERIETDWKRFRPRLHLVDVQIHKKGEAASATFLKVDEIILGLNPLASAMHGRVEVDEITVVGTHLSVSRDDRGRVSVNGITVYTPGDRASPRPAIGVPPALQNRTIRLADSSIDYKDAIWDIDYHLDAVNLSGHFTPRSNNVFLSVNLPPSLGESLEVGLAFSGDLRDVDTLKGRAFIRGVAVDLPAWARKFDKRHIVLGGQMNVDAWLKFGHGWRLAGKLDLQTPRLNLAGLAGGAGTDEWALQALATNFQLAKDGDRVKLDLQNLQLTNDDEVNWPESGLSLESRLTDGANFKQGRLALDFVRLRELLPLLRVSPALQHRLAGLGVDGLEGDFYDLYLDWDLLGAQPAWNLRTAFSGAGVRGHERMPSVSGLKGRLDVSNAVTTVQLDASAVDVDYPKLFRQPLQITGLRGDVRIGKVADRITVSSRDLKLQTPHIQGRIGFDLTLGGDQPPFIDAYAVYENGDLAATSRYLPVGIMHDKTVEWFDQAFIAGRLVQGDLEWRGPLKGFPYRHGEGLFRIDLDGRDTVMSYAHDWPVASGIDGHLHMSGASLSVAVHDARIFDSIVSNVDFHVDDVKDAVIDLEGQHYGPMADIVRYLRESPLHEKFAAVADQLAVTGTQASNMRLHIPIKKKPGREPGYAFSTAVYRGTFDFQDWGLQLGEVNARFDYSDAATGSAPFDTLLNGQPVTVQLGSEDNGDVTRMTVGVHGKGDPNRLLQKAFPAGLPQVTGVTDFDAEVRLALRNDRDIPPVLHVESALQGVELSYPAPFRKPAAAAERLGLDARFQPDHEVIADLEYGDWLRGRLALAPNGDGRLSISRANLQANTLVPPRLPAEGITIQGHVPVLNIDDWWDLDQGGGDGPGLVDKFERADLHVGRFTYLNRTLDGAGIRMSRETNNWKLDIQSALLRGDILIPRDGFEHRGLAINLEYLDVDRLNAGAHGGKPPLPTTVPPFQLSADKIVLNDWQLKNVKMLAAPIDGGIKAHSIRIEDPSIGMQGEGEWTVDENSRQHTELSVRFDSNNVGRGLENFGYSKIIRDGHGTAEFDVHWDGAPADFSLDLLEGSANLSLKDGQILDIDPGGGRLLGLLSVQTIPRRLALDFKDVFAKGLRFDKMKGHFNFADGNAYTNDYQIDGPPGRIDIEGRTGLLARDYDQRVLFRPDLSSSLPVVGTLLGGTSAGVAMIVVDRIARLFGKQTDDLARFEYTLTGSWDDPVFTRILKRTGKGKTALSDADSVE